MTLEQIEALESACKGEDLLGVEVDPDDLRALLAIARAWSMLPESVRAELGERP